MAAHFGVSESAVNQWKNRVPTRRILAVSAYTSFEVTAEEMLQDAALDAEQASVAEAGEGA